jgi:hypothetical protein
MEKSRPIPFGSANCLLHEEGVALPAVAPSNHLLLKVIAIKNLKQYENTMKEKLFYPAHYQINERNKSANITKCLTYQQRREK